MHLILVAILMAIYCAEAVDGEQCLTLFLKYLLPTALASRVIQSPPSARLSIRLFPYYFWNRLTFDLELLHVYR